MKNILAPDHERCDSACSQLFLDGNEFIIGLGKPGNAGIGISLLAVNNALRHIYGHWSIPHFALNLRRVLEKIQQIARQLNDFTGIGKNLGITHFHQIGEFAYCILGLQPIQISR
ncbi:hypothetical protein D3C75_1065000 [compost metagenome]